ncbi:MAG: hypothetical protein JWM28_3238 [Chitinophagaceae bacterium]|nr:hypothetical protein [Chitinophagaceae bacterium]
MKREGFEAERLVYYETDDEEKLLNNVFAAHDEFNLHFSEVLINYSFPQSVTVPSKFYNYGDGKKMLQLMHGDEEGEAVLAEHLPEWQLYNVYEVPKPVYGWISRRFHSGKYWHSYTSSLNNFLADAGSDSFLVDFKTGQFSVIVIKAGKFQLAQTFAYTEPADVLYYLLKICNEFSVSQKEVKLVLSGFLEKQSTLYRELYNYFVRVSFQQIPDFIKLSGSFEEYPAYFFSSLFKLATCAS